MKDKLRTMIKSFCAAIMLLSFWHTNSSAAPSFTLEFEDNETTVRSFPEQIFYEIFTTVENHEGFNSEDKPKVKQILQTLLSEAEIKFLLDRFTETTSNALLQQESSLPDSEEELSALFAKCLTETSLSLKETCQQQFLSWINYLAQHKENISSLANAYSKPLMRDFLAFDFQLGFESGVITANYEEPAYNANTALIYSKIHPSSHVVARFVTPAGHDAAGPEAAAILRNHKNFYSTKWQTKFTAEELAELATVFSIRGVADLYTE